MHYIRFNASGCIKASRSTDVFLAIALIISGRPRVPIGLFAQKGLYSAKSKSNTSLSAEEKVQAESIRFFPHFFRLASSQKQWKLTKSLCACLFPSLCNFGSEIILISIYFGSEPTLIGKIRLSLLSRLGHWRFLVHAF